MTTVLLCVGGALYALGLLFTWALCRMAKLADEGLGSEGEV